MGSLNFCSVAVALLLAVICWVKCHLVAGTGHQTNTEAEAHTLPVKVARHSERKLHAIGEHYLCHYQEKVRLKRRSDQASMLSEAVSARRV